MRRCRRLSRRTSRRRRTRRRYALSVGARCCVRSHPVALAQTPSCRRPTASRPPNSPPLRSLRTGLAAAGGGQPERRRRVPVAAVRAASVTQRRSPAARAQPTRSRRHARPCARSAWPRNRLRTSRGVAGRAGGHGVARAGEAGVGCRATPGVADEQLLAQVESEADVFAATRRDSRGFGTARCGCAARHGGGRCTRPASRRRCRRIAPYGVAQQLRVRCGIPPASRSRTTACQRVGHEAKRSNAAVLRRQCPRHSHGGVLDVAVRNVPKLRVYNRARRRRWRRWRAERGAASEVPRSNRSPDRRGGLGLNVLLLMLDSIAAERFARGMPITHALLERWRDADAGASGANGGTKRGWRSFKLTNWSSLARILRVTSFRCCRERRR